MRRLLIAFYPPSFRREFGADVLQLQADLRADCRSRADHMRLTVRTARQLPGTTINEWIETMNEASPASRAAITLVGCALIAATVFAVGPLGFVPLIALLAWIAHDRSRGRYEMTGTEHGWGRWLVAGLATLAVALVPLVFNLSGDWLWAVTGLLTMLSLAFLSVAAVHAMTAFMVRRKRSRER